MGATTWLSRSASCTMYQMGLRSGSPVNQALNTVFSAPTGIVKMPSPLPERFGLKYNPSARLMFVTCAGHACVGLQLGLPIVVLSRLWRTLEDASGSTVPA